MQCERDCMKNGEIFLLSKMATKKENDASTYAHMKGHCRDRQVNKK